MSEAEIGSLLETCELLRVAFYDGRSMYLVPLGCVWVDGALYGVADAGRKTQIAAEHPDVAFQTDTARQTGLFEWESVTGNGEFEIVTSPSEVGMAMAKLQPFVAAAPDWWKAEQAPKMSSGQLLVWRLRPTATTGVRYIPPS
jgi:nitroimidazol reductase NimA-like FMN-containing flavoprotein (pyridoxamine 5'-phosphate oxidase superfamily)